ncbi:PTS transporter subunit EIIA, partial [Escherichia coli]|nr:PTS transporter subunit EIIA [Escherichia coli]EEV7745417.1 PTS transporter subunit EIIA [Escherichia coli]
MPAVRSQYGADKFSTEVVQVVEQVKDWREAVAISCRPLIENGSIEPRYVDAIFRSHDTI